MNRYRITVRGDGVELRGYIDGSIHTVDDFARIMTPVGPVVASLADADYDPFKEAELRELHHFETEQENARLTEENRKLRALTHPVVLEVLDE